MKNILLFLLLFPLVGNGQIITTIAGTGSMGYSGDGGAASSAQLYGPNGIVVDTDGNILIADSYNHVIRKINASGVISTIAGNGTGGFSGDGGSALSASLYVPAGMAFDKSGNLFIAENANHRIRKINPSGIISTIAGIGTAGYSGDGGSATAAELRQPVDIAIDTFGNLYVSDAYNYCIRKINTSGIISTYAGNGISGYSGDGGQATNAQMKLPTQIELDATGNLYISDKSDNRIRKVTPTGIITTVAGIGTIGFSGDGSTAISAQFRGPSGVLIIADSLFIADQANYRIRKVDASGIITTIAGNGVSGYSGDGGPAILAELNAPYCLATDLSKNIYFSDGASHCIRKISYNTSNVNVIEISQVNTVIYPNPATTELKITSATKINQVTITNLFGKITNIPTPSIIGETSAAINIADLPPGVYVLCVNNSLRQNFIKE